MKKNIPSTVSYPFQLTKIDGSGYHPFITFFHENKPYNALIDCGASHSFLNKDFFENISEENQQEKQAVGMESGFSIWATTSEIITLSNIIISNIMLLKADLSHINKSLSMLGFAPIDGILGCDLLQHLEANIDFEHQQLIFQNAKQTHQLHLEGDFFFTITLTLNHNPLRLLLDTGASQTLLNLPVANTLFPENAQWELNNGPTIGISPNDIINANRLMTITFDNARNDDVPHWDICFTALKMNKINRSYQSVGVPKIDAILGVDFLKNVCKNIDFKEKMIIIEQ